MFDEINICLALSVDQGHKSKIVGLRTVTYSNVSATNEEVPDEVSKLGRHYCLGTFNS